MNAVDASHYRMNPTIELKEPINDKAGPTAMPAAL